MNGYQHLFPKLTSRNHRTTSPRTPNYNCIAWAAEENERWWQPEAAHLGYYWPPKAKSGMDIGSLIDAFASLGYKKCADGTLVAGFKKIALFGLLPVSRTQSLGVMMEPEVDYGTQGIQPRVQA
jgi:hypothetical protein